VGQTIPLTPAEQRFLAEHPRIRLMVDPHYEPADFIDDKTRQHSGMAADLLNLLSQRTGLNFVPVPLDAEGRRELDPIKRGVDGVALSSLNDQRSEFYLSTEPILEFPAYILSRKSAFDRFVTPLDLHGMTVAVVSDYAVVDYLKEHYPQITLKEFPTTNDGLKALSYDEVHAMVASIPTSTYWLEKEGYANLKIAGESGFIYRLGVTSRKDWPELHSILQKGVASLTPAERDEVRRKWLNAPYEPFFRSWYFWRPVLIIILILLAAIVIILFFNQLLRNRVRKRTRELAESEKLYRLT
jgi:ABC-type amino acid transport substrate-binding protein